MLTLAHVSLIIVLVCMDNPFQPKPQPWWQQTLSYSLEIIKVFLIALVIVVPVRLFLFQPFYVQGASMEPNFYDREYLIIDELSYRLRAPERGEVVVFKYPNNPQQYYIKRIIGIPGDTVKVTDGDVFRIDTDGEVVLIDESEYLDDAVTTQSYNVSEITLDEEQYFMLGDNRSASYDSRYFGSVADSFLVGRVLVRVLPFDRFNWFGY